jgi:hypothetical protein
MAGPAEVSGAGRPATRRGFGRVLREPLLHFLLIGLGLFVLYSLVNDPPAAAPDDREIVVTPQVVAGLATQFEAVWRRPPTGDEMDGLLEDYLTEEIFYREALALGLDREDTVIRRRLRQKMEFLSESGAGALAPDETVLRTYYEANLPRFTAPGAISFAQVYLGEAPGPDEVAVVGASLAAGADPATLGRRTLLPGRLDASPPVAVDGVFGAGFFEALAGLPVGEWQGPVRSGFGVHFVRVESAEAAAPRPFETVRDAVAEVWRQETAETLRRERFELLRSRYTIVRTEEEAG